MDIAALHKLLSPSTGDEDDIDAQLDGSTPASCAFATPGTIGPKTKAAPKPQPVAKKEESKDIWGAEEVDNAPSTDVHDPRPHPEYETLFRQAVTPEDMYLGMGGRDPSSFSCEEMLVRIHLPETALADIQLDVTDTLLDLRCPRFRLHLPLPHRVDGKNGKAQWDGKASKLSVTLRVMRDYDFLKQ